MIDADTEKRELIAINGSAYNQIIDNRFSRLDKGRIYLYRNCGVRRQYQTSNTQLQCDKKQHVLL